MTEGSPDWPIAWLGYPLKALLRKLGEDAPSAEIRCELLDGSRIEAATEDDLRIVRAARIDGPEGIPVRYHLLVDRSPQIHPEQVRALQGGSRFGKDANRA